MRILVIGDIHGAYKALIQVLERVNIQDQDKFIFLGDYADGWSQTPQVIDFLIDFGKKYDCTFLRGNHDDLCLDFLSGKSMEKMWYFHGGDATEKAYESIPEETKQKHIDFLKKLSNYQLDSQNRLFVHAGFTNLRGVEYEYFPKAFYWDRTLWELAISVEMSPEQIRYPNRLKLYSEIFIGHTPTVRFETDKPMSANNVWNIDTGAAFKGRITVMDINTKEFWQSNPVFELYPEEMGRNK
ncbi:Diadenosine 5',5'''-P1,P4-tetraphosphate asymmetrical hydrolase [Capnocytophaga canis]|uniref:metallophosphoesterase family protein n=1 Tax=Capnocytophaga canis TaxID=1848903 RepID=UPI00058993B1|nr:metallophosphoesterase family protein [Capnocytophaga canis]CEN46887.1 Diadenosine 5',5'''-P1,P4-tetraphosphate asymmetrical hydrolase [Capnocytophaga canis]